MERGCLTAGLLAGTIIWGVPAAAADIAVLIDNAEVRADARAVDTLAESLGAWEVYRRDGADLEAMAQVLGEVSRRLSDADRLLLVFAGPVRTDGRATWLIPEDFAAGPNGGARIAAETGAVRLDLLTDLAGGVPGRAAVIVAQSGGGGPAGLQDGIGDPDLPQGVLLLSGAADDALPQIAERLLTGDRDAAAALDGIRDVTVRGFASPDMGFGAATAAAAPQAAVQPAAAPEAPAAPRSDAERAEAAETALALDQSQRRLVQERLTVLGYSTRGIDGIFGAGTRAAVTAWQEREGLSATGFLTERQLGLLERQAETRSAEMAAEAEATKRAEEAADAAFWRTTGANGRASDLRAYLDRYPQGIYSQEARAALDGLEAEDRATAAESDRRAWDQAQGGDDVEAYRQYLAEQPSGAFAGQAEARIAELTRAPGEAQALADAEAREAGMGLGSGSRALIEGQLAALGYDVGAQDGTFDGQARGAIEAFQAERGLGATGYVDQATVQALIVASLGLR